jgi:K+-sensing histidine kinase KdpD
LNDGPRSEAGNLGTALDTVNGDAFGGLIMSKTTRTILIHYGGAVLFTALAVLIRWLLDPILGEYHPLTTLFGPVAFAVWLGGYRPALFAMVLGYLACNYLFIEPRGEFSPINSVGFVRLMTYLLSRALLILI